MFLWFLLTNSGHYITPCEWFLVYYLLVFGIYMWYVGTIFYWSVCSWVTVRFPLLVGIQFILYDSHVVIVFIDGYIDSNLKGNNHWTHKQDRNNLWQLKSYWKEHDPIITWTKKLKFWMNNPLIIKNQEL